MEDPTQSQTLQDPAGCVKNTGLDPRNNDEPSKSFTQANDRVWSL